MIASRMFLGEAFGHLSGIDTVNVVVELAEEILQPGLKLPPVAFPCDGKMGTRERVVFFDGWRICRTFSRERRRRMRMWSWMSG